MQYSISFLPWLIPCLGAGLTIALSPSIISDRVRRWAQVAILLVTCITLALVQGATDPTWSPPQPLMDQFEPLAFSYDQRRTTMAWLPLGLLALLNLGLMMNPLEHPKSARQLALVGMVLATIAAANPFTLGIVWGLTDLLLLALKLRDTPQEEPYLLIRYGAGNLLSIMALAVGTAFTSGRERAFLTNSLVGPPRASLPWFALAAFLRLGIYPLPQHHGKAWEIDLTSLFTGIYLWRQVGMLQTLILTRLPVLFIALLLLAMGLLANRAADFSSAWPYVSMYGILLSLFPILVGGNAGAATTLSLASLWALGLTLRHLYIRASVPRDISPWLRAPMIVALAALAGLPPSLGFMARWSLLQLCWLHGHWGVILAVSTASLLISIPLWRQLDELLTFFGNYERLQGMELIPIVVAALWATALLVGGIWPGTGAIRGLLSQPLTGSVLLLLALLPPVGGYLLHEPRRRSYTAPWAQRLAPAMDLEWLYTGVERASQRVDAWLVTLYTTLEDSLGLGWILIWGLALVLYLVER
ncbi:MAG: proton-conducting transporter membrane subunit [Anaerolineae bacterium]